MNEFIGLGKGGGNELAHIHRNNIKKTKCRTWSVGTPAVRFSPTQVQLMARFATANSARATANKTTKDAHDDANGVQKGVASAFVEKWQRTAGSSSAAPGVSGIHFRTGREPLHQPQRVAIDRDHWAG